MSKEFQIRDGNLIASFDLENEDGDIDFCKLLKVSHGVADEIGMFVDYVATNKIIKDQSKQISDLEAKLAEKEEKKESYRLQNDEHHLQLCQFYSRLGVEAFGADIHEKALETLMIMKEEIEEKNGVRRALSVCNRRNDEFADMIKKLEGEKEELKQQLAEKEERINWLVEAVFNRKWAKKYVEMRRKEDPMLCLPDSDEVYERYFEQKEYIEKLEADLDQAFNLDDIYAEKTSKMAKEFNDVLDKAIQDKISFAVEQLEQIKWIVEDIQCACGDDNNINRDFLIEEIDNQIAELTHQHEDKGE